MHSAFWPCLLPSVVPSLGVRSLGVRVANSSPRQLWAVHVGARGIVELLMVRWPSKKPLRLAWEDDLWRNAPRAKPDDEQNLITCNSSCRFPKFIRLGCALWARSWFRHFLSRSCGREWPSKTHVTWLPTKQPAVTSMPANKPEERLLVRSIQMPPSPSKRRECDLLNERIWNDQMLLGIASRPRNSTPHTASSTCTVCVNPDAGIIGGLNGWEGSVYGGEGGTGWTC